MKDQNVVGCAQAFGEHSHCSLTYILFLYYSFYSFPNAKNPSIFGLHRQCRCQKVCLVRDCVASIGTCVPLHGLGFNYVFVAKSGLCGQRELNSVLA